MFLSSAPKAFFHKETNRITCCSKLALPQQYKIAKDPAQLVSPTVCRANWAVFTWLLWRVVQALLESLLCMFAWFSFVPSKNRMADSMPMLQVANRCDRLIDDGADMTLWIRKGSQLKGPFRLDALRESRFRWSSVLQNHARRCHTYRCRQDAGCSWIQRNTRVSSALARALSPPRARVLCSQVWCQPSSVT